MDFVDNLNNIDRVKFFIYIYLKIIFINLIVILYFFSSIMLILAYRFYYILIIQVIHKIIFFNDFIP